MIQLKGIFLVFMLFISTLDHFKGIGKAEPYYNNNNCSSTDSIIIFHASSERQHDENEMVVEILINETTSDTNVSHFKTSTDWNNWPNLKFPSTNLEKQYKMANLHLEKGIFVFDFLRKFLSFIQPYDIPIDLLIDAIENRLDTSTLISKSIHLEAGPLTVFAICFILCCVIPGIELWLACRPLKEDYKPSQHPGILTFSLAFFICILGLGMIVMIICNETMSTSVEKFPVMVEAALQDLNDYHSSTTIQLRKYLLRSLDVASEAIFADLDISQKVSSNVESLLNDGENIRNLGKELTIEINNLRQNLESALRACTGQDRPLCTIIDSSGLRVTLRIDQLIKDTRLLRLHNTKQENLTKTIRQVRGEYLYIPQHIARNSLEARNQIRREVNKMRARIFDEARSMEASNSELVKQLEFARRLMDYTTPYIVVFEHVRWLIGIGTVLCILLIWLLLLGALCCRCGAYETKIRFTLLCGVFMACIISIILWIVFIMTLILSSHTEMLICRPLHDPNYNTLQAILETRIFLGKRLSVPLKDLFEKCRMNEPAYPAFGLGNTMKLEQLAAYWTWSSFSRIILKIKVELRTLNIFPRYFERQLHDLLYACGLNLTEHRIMIQGKILNKDLEILSDQLDKVTQRMNDKLTARSLETIVAIMQDINSRRLKPLMKLQDKLLYNLAALELQIQPLQTHINYSLSHLKNIQYYIDNEGDKIAQLKTKAYTDRLANYLDQWRFHVLSEMGNGIAKCRPLWDVLEGIKLLLCNHFLGNLSGYWFVTFICAIIMIASTPTAHILSLVYKNLSNNEKDANLVSTRSEDPPTEPDQQENWNTPEPPPPPSSEEGWQ